MLNICFTVNKQPRNMSITMVKGCMETMYGVEGVKSNSEQFFLFLFLNFDPIPKIKHSFSIGVCITCSQITFIIII